MYKKNDACPQAPVRELWLKPSVVATEVQCGIPKFVGYTHHLRASTHQ